MRLHFVLKTLLLLILFSSCNNSNNNPKTILDKIENNITKGKWIITKFIDSGNDETSDYNGYVFDFKTSGILLANKNTDSYTGNWEMEDSNSSDDSLDDLDFILFFSAPPLLEELSEDWDIISQSSTKIELIHISGGNGGTDYLTFQKN